MGNARVKFGIGLAVGVLSLVAIGVVAYLPRVSQASAEAPVPVPVIEADGWYCPMHAHVTSDHEGSCPICGMKLVKRTSASTVAEPEQVFVAAGMQSRLGVRTEEIRAEQFSASVTVSAVALADERRAVTVSPKVEGWIKHLGVSVVGQPVRAGQTLYEIYSPELQQRQRDYIDLLRRRDSLLEAKRASGEMLIGNSQPDLMLASVARERYRARSRLLAADVPGSVLDELERFRRVRDVVPVLAERDGVVANIGAREGTYIRPGELVLSYADSRAAWAEISLNPETLRHVSVGAVVELRSGTDTVAPAVSVPVDARSAVMDPVTRTARIRVSLGSEAGTFLAGALLDGRILTKPRHALTVPTDSVLRTGAGDFVMLAQGQDHFSRADVRLGAENGERVEVLEGLHEGQRVVTNGQFLLSAEGSLRSSWRRLADTSDTAKGHGMDEMMSVSDTPAHDHLAH